MKVKILEPAGFDRRYDLRGLAPSQGPVVIATILAEDGHQVEVLSEYVSSFDIDRINQADLIGISITTYNARRGYEIARHAQKPVVFGGFHASLMPNVRFFLTGSIGYKMKLLCEAVFRHLEKRKMDKYAKEILSA